VQASARMREGAYHAGHVLVVCRMRRSTPNCEAVAQAQRAFLVAIEALDQHELGAMVAELEPFANEARRHRLRSVIDARLDSVTVLFDSPYDPHNGAAVLRSCDAFGVQRLHVIERQQTFLAAREVARGSQRWVDVRTYTEGAPAALGLRAGGFELIATHPEGELVPEDLPALGRIALVLGNERDGIASDLALHCGRSVRVPMRGFAESLNVSVTAAILLRAATAGRPGDLSPLERSRLYLRALALTLPHAPDILAARGLTWKEAG
jgi:tRNA (guanosine-2'-O-)-methyltransferase